MSALEKPLKTLAALLLGVALCEVGLRLAAGVAQSGTGRATEVGSGPAIVCYGDSNVFGIYETAEDSYPGQLAALVEARVPDGPRVVNRGLPGLSTRHVLARATEDLAAARPVAMLVTAGVNNRWAWVPDGKVVADEPPWHERLRLTRLARLLLSRGSAEPAAPPARGETRMRIDETGAGAMDMTDRDGRRWRYTARSEGLDVDRFRESIRSDLTELHERARAAGVPVYLVTYGASGTVYGETNALLRQVAGDQGIPLVESAALLHELSERHGFDRVFYPDLHPRSVGYELIARNVHDHLVEADLLPGPPVGDLLAGLAPADEGDAELRLVGRLRAGSPDEALTVELTGGEPGRAFSLVLWGLRDAGAPYEWKSFDQLAQDPLARLTSKAPELEGRFDHNGEARVSLAPLLRAGDLPERLSGMQVQACYLLYHAGVGDGLERISRESVLTIP